MNLQHVAEVILQPQPQLATPQNNDARDPSVQRWVNSGEAATPMNATQQPPALNAAGSAPWKRLLEALRIRKEAEECRKERDNLRQIVAQSEEQHQQQLADAVAAAIERTKKEVTAAANAAYKREMQKQSDKEREKGEQSRNALQHAKATIANAQAAANQVRASKRTRRIKISKTLV